MEGSRKTKLNTLERPGKGEWPPPPQNAAELREYPVGPVLGLHAPTAGVMQLASPPAKKKPTKFIVKKVTERGWGRTVLEDSASTLKMCKFLFHGKENETWNPEIGLCKDMVYKRKIKENSNRQNAKFNEKLSSESRDGPNVFCFVLFCF